LLSDFVGDLDHDGKRGIRVEHRHRCVVAYVADTELVQSRSDAVEIVGVVNADTQLE